MFSDMKYVGVYSPPADVCVFLQRDLPPPPQKRTQRIKSLLNGRKGGGQSELTLLKQSPRCGAGPEERRGVFPLMEQRWLHLFVKTTHQPLLTHSGKERQLTQKRGFGFREEDKNIQEWEKPHSFRRPGVGIIRWRCGDLLKGRSQRRVTAAPHHQRSI